MLAVGAWACFLGGNHRSAAVLVPASFLAMMALGAVAGFAGIKLPLAEAAILASVFVFGALMINAVRLPAGWCWPAARRCWSPTDRAIGRAPSASDKFGTLLASCAPTGVPSVNKEMRE
jgi:hypothetical protein